MNMARSMKAQISQKLVSLRRRLFWNQASAITPWSLSTVLLKFNDGELWTIQDACQGTQCFGSTGSGKTTGSVAAIAESFLLAGFGGLFLTAKPDDASTYLRLCEKAGRSSDVMLFRPNGTYRFNPFDSELKRRDAGAGLTHNVVAMLSALLEVSERNQANGGGDSDGYWKRANRQLCLNCVDLSVMAMDRISVPDLYRIAISAPTSLEQLQLDSWKASSFCYQCLMDADKVAKGASRKLDFKLVADYFCLEWPCLSDRTRSVVLSTFTSMLDVLNRGLIRDLMSGETNISPEMAQDGKIIIVDLPTMLFGEVGVFTQVLWKYCMQRAQERRDVQQNPRPVFIVSDESHLTVVKQDQVFQTTARSTRTAVVYATQSISNYLATFGSDSEAEVHSLLGNLQSKFFHQQSDIKTNQYAAELIGRSRQYLINASSSKSDTDYFASLFGQRQGQSTGGVSECYEFEVHPNDFAMLRKGGPPHWIVDAILYQGGRKFGPSGKSWVPVSFKQSV